MNNRQRAINFVNNKRQHGYSIELAVAIAEDIFRVDLSHIYWN